MNENYYRTMSKIILYQFCIINKYYFDVKGAICDERRARGRARAGAGARASLILLSLRIRWVAQTIQNHATCVPITASKNGQR